ncbi:MAG: hypothetical protein H6861_00590 [Rhodospirillales bacterium]|nr:hypothetical protein [Rhodospirillales bacterium]
MTKKYWLIEGYDSLDRIYERKIPVGSMTDSQITNALKALAAKEGLDLNEIIGAYAKRKTKVANDLLEVRRTSPFLDMNVEETLILLRE